MWMRKAPKALFGSRRDQKKFARSIVVPHSAPGKCLSMTWLICVKDGKLNVGRGCGDKVFVALKSAMKAAFSDDFGRKNTDRLSCDGPT